MEMMRGEVDNHGNRLTNKSPNSWYPEQEAIADLALMVPFQCTGPLLGRRAPCPGTHTLESPALDLLSTKQRVHRAQRMSPPSACPTLCTQMHCGHPELSFALSLVPRFEQTSFLDPSSKS